MFNKNFYPTPNNLIDKMLSKTNIDYHINILEPSAGKGNIVDRILERNEGNRYKKHKVDVIELDKELQATLKGKGCTIVHDDFLTFQTFKRYALIVMNPPFDNGCKHLLKAIELQNRGGEIVCLLNAETIKNPYSNERMELVRLLEDYEANIEYIDDGFVNSERKTDVQTALIYINIPHNKKDNSILNKLKSDIKARNILNDEQNNILTTDSIKGAIQKYNFEVEVGINLIQNYYSIEPIIQDSFKGDYNNPILKLSVRGNDSNKNCVINDYIEEVRYKYWKGLIDMDMFRQILTTNLIEDFQDLLEDLRNYDFSSFNVKRVMLELQSNLQLSVEETIYKLFTDFTHRYTYDEFSSNVHLFNGWKTNKCYKINDKKVIIPYMNGFDSYTGKFSPAYGVEGKLRDIEKSLNYLDGGRTNTEDDIRDILNTARELGQSKNIDFKYFTVTFYKKGTCHLSWKDKELIKKLNIFGSKKAGHLPPSYAKDRYEDMSKEAQEVVDSFEGKDEYNKVMNNKQFYLYDSNTILQIADNIN